MYDPYEFFKKLEKNLIQADIELSKDWFIDHICYRTESLKEYEKVKSDFSIGHELLVESMVGGRMIATFKLSQPFKYKDFIIPLIEIPAPKKGRVSQSGFEHVEIVVKESFKELKEKFSHLDVKTHSLTKAINPELEVEFKDMSIKFHHQSLEEVIE